MLEAKRQLKYYMSSNILLHYMREDIINFYRLYYRLYIRQLYNKKILLSNNLDLLKIKLNELIKEYKLNN